jgi:cellulose synthase/poly-beta-1,6-N-acetylglucosamine synthase-like glycosyltransferase
MTETGMLLVLFAAGFAAYAYVGYPLILWLWPFEVRDGGSSHDRSGPWPSVSISVPAYNESSQVPGLIESLLAIDYPRDRLQILIVSDGSTDGTDDLVRSYAHRGVELLRVEDRRGKTAVENEAASHLTGEIVVNTDASIRIRPEAVKLLVARFSDPDVGLASGRDVSVSRADSDGNLGESGYVGYEMWIRDLETLAGGIVGASGCFYAIRSNLHRIPVPDSLSRDFAAALKCQEHGFRAVSVPDAVCLVPRTPSLRKEYRRKVRTITRGMETLMDHRALLNPFRHGLFAWKLWSHKVCRWAAPWAAVLGAVGLGLLASYHSWALAALSLGMGVTLLGAVGWILGDGRPLPRILQVPAFALAGNVAAMQAFLRVVSGDRDPVWEPTRREGEPLPG